MASLASFTTSPATGHHLRQHRQRCSDSSSSSRSTRSGCRQRQRATADVAFFSHRRCLHHRGAGLLVLRPTAAAPEGGGGDLSSGSDATNNDGDGDGVPPAATSSPQSQQRVGGGGGGGGGGGYGGPNWSADSQSIAPPSPRRVFLGVLATSGLALGGNFLGVTGKLLGSHPEFAASTRLDVIYPVNGLKRCYSPDKGYEFVYPVEYLADQTQAQRNAAQREAATPLDPPPIGGGGGGGGGGAGAGAGGSKPAVIFGQVVQEPQSAFGPMGGTGEENVSVIVSRSPPGWGSTHLHLTRGGFRLDRFGDARSQAEWLLANVLARPGSGKEAELFGAYTRKSPNGGVSYYTFEYTIRTDKWYRHNVAVFAEFGGRLYTMVAQVPQSGWASREADFRNIAESFRVFVPTG